ncbi:cupin domain-containing protein [uncultured Parolsenella sp.]|uniref:cupin domain-containing protein n=1 Tax=uncultured Parolsenella sp. TaxID=2083008 RepID=UPI0028059FCC|nr:cupin domain-containing protein [uncultured Parolsenella sp.]
MAEILTHIAFYAGWPNAWAAFHMAKEVYADDATEAEGHGGFFGLGEPNDAFAQYFIGQSYLKSLTGPDDYLPIHNVTFEPGCRNNWHVHHATAGGGQVLICVEGEGWYQEEGKPARSLKPGDVVEIPANVKHWHGAKTGCWFSHLAFGFPGEDVSNEWLEPVDDEQYAKLDR